MSDTERSFQLSGTFAVCQWPQQHPNRHIMGKPVEMWCRCLTEPEINSFVPVENISSRVIIAVECINDEHLLVVIPLVN